MWFLYLLGIVVAIVIDYIIAKKFKEIAEMKGHEGSTYFWFTFLLGIIGMLMVVALPSRDTVVEKKVETKKNITAATTGIAHKNGTTQGDYKICPKCGMKINKKDKACWSCGQSLTD